MPKKITISEVNLRLKNKNIKCVDEYVNTSTKTTFQCLKKNCKHIWKTKPSCIFSGDGCAKCAGLVKITSSDFDIFLKSKNIKCLDVFNNSHHKIRLQCLKETCEYVWKTTVSSFKYRKDASCPKCSKKAKLTNKDVDLRILDKKLKRLDDYVSGKKKINFQCLICKYVWLAKPETILGKKSGCPNCSQKVKLNNDTFDEKIYNRKIKRLDDYVNAYTKINFKCLNDNCEYEWSARPGSILHKYCGCPICNKSNKNEKLFNEVLLSLNINFTSQYKLRSFNKKEKPYIVDFYFPDFNIIIEYNGAQHYRPICFGGMSAEKAKDNFEKQIKRDEYVRNFCKENNINIMEIDGRKINGKKINKEFISKLLNKYIDENIVKI
jgi:very-short-patch-repair endonuclease